MTWRERWAAKIAKIDAELPDHATLEERKNAIKHLTPSKYDPSWAKKSWQAARRDYLMRFGYVPRTKKQKEKERLTALPLPLFKN